MAYSKFEQTGLWTSAKYHVRDVEKPFYVVLDGKCGEKTLHRNVGDGLAEVLSIRESGKPAGLLRIDIDRTTVIASVKPKIVDNYKPVEFTIV